uniref:Uncharacterized protein MANES_02G004500 n=1 Tax=Rhizophora mucronata TaxID=61149 RepID=A0A2P2K8T3_RHIMU
MTAAQKGNLEAFKLLLILKPSLALTLPPQATKFSFTKADKTSEQRVLSQNTGVSGCSGECKYTNKSLNASLDLCSASMNPSVTKFGLVEP